MNHDTSNAAGRKPLGTRVIWIGFWLFLLGGMCRSSIATLGIFMMVVGAVIWARQNVTVLPAGASAGSTRSTTPLRPQHCEPRDAHQAHAGSTATSFMAGAATGSAAAGWAIGGDLLGALMGGMWGDD